MRTEKYELHHGDCREVMATMPDNSVDAIVTDPPYGLSFMGKGWDHGVPGEEFWAEALRVAKPGAHLLAFGGTRTFHRLACAIEDAGWEIRDTVGWIYGSGFPKSHDVSKAIDKVAGAEREVVGSKRLTGNACVPAKDKGVTYGVGVGVVPPQDVPVTAPATEAAKQWDGWGTALKPAWEPVIVARKPLVGTVAANVLEYGTGAINVNGCRVGTAADMNPRDFDDSRRTAPKFSGNYNGGKDGQYRTRTGAIPPGRWPANIIHDGSDDVLALFPVTGGGGASSQVCQDLFFVGKKPRPGYKGRVTEPGSAARFFYTAKASKRDRDEGCEGLEERVASVGNTDAAGRDGGNPNNYVGDSQRRRVESGLPATMPRRNHHPTVKPTDLMRYLCRLVTPPDGVVLDPFMGSGSTGKAALLEGFRFIGIEREAEYLEIARARIKAVQPALVYA